MRYFNLKMHLNKYSVHENPSTFPRQLHCRYRPTAFTLLEVVVGIVLLASLVSGVVVAMGAHHRKIRFARQKASAVHLTDELLSRWDQSQDGIPLSQVGNLVADGSMVWRTDVVQRRELCGVPVHVVRLNVFGKSSERITVLCSVDLVVNAKQAGLQP